jgi:hypothetical protein
MKHLIMRPTYGKGGEMTFPWQQYYVILVTVSIWIRAAQEVRLNVVIPYS